MRAAMFAAELGDDVLEGDPTVRALERAYAAWVGKEGALYLPSGTMAKQIALGAWTHPGEEFMGQVPGFVCQPTVAEEEMMHGFVIGGAEFTESRTGFAGAALRPQHQSPACGGEGSGKGGGFGIHESGTG